MIAKAERPHSIALPQDEIGLPYREIRTNEGTDSKAILLNLEDAIKHGIFPLGNPETGLMNRSNLVRFEQRKLEEWGGKFQNGLLIPTDDLRSQQGRIEQAIIEVAVNLVPATIGLAEEGVLERLVNLGTLLTIKSDPEIDSARRAFALAEKIAKAAEKRDIEDTILPGKYYPSMAAVEKVKAKYDPFFNFVVDRRLDTLPPGPAKFYQADIEKGNAEERQAVSENGSFLAQRVKLPAR